MTPVSHCLPGYRLTVVQVDPASFSPCHARNSNGRNSPVHRLRNDRE
jgi:hypothetical protein